MTNEARDDERIDPEIARFVAAILDGSARHPDLAARSHAERRAIAETIRAPWRAGGPTMVRTEDLTTTGDHAVRLRMFDPGADDARPRPALVYVHGGGFILFSLDTHERLMREYAARTGAIVIGVDYSLSPEVRYPVALHEIVASIDWVRAQAPRLGIDPARIAIGGDSAGANLSLAACLVLRDRGDGDVVAATLFNYGFFDADFDTPSQRRHGTPGKLLTSDELDDYLVQYLGEESRRDDPLALPALAALHGLPPSLHVVAACDPLADGDRRLADRMRAVGNAVEVLECEGATHSFLEAVSVSRIANAALTRSADWLRSVLAPVSADAAR